MFSYISFQHSISPDRWCNADQDILACSSCKEALAITLHSYLSVDSVDKICKVYRQKLATAHKKDCPFRLDGEQFLRLDDTQCEKTVIPAYMASVFPHDLVELMENRSPSSILRQHVKKLEDICLSIPSTKTRWNYPKLVISEEIRKYSSSEEDDGHESSFISDISCLLGTHDQSVAILAILGWTPITDTPNPVVSLGCPICLSLMELTLEKYNEDSESKEGTESEPRSKKQRKLAMFCNPHDAHRHYCPFQMGFPTTMSGHATPMWRTLLSRLHQEKKSNESLQEPTVGLTEDSDNYDKIRSILWSAIVPKKVDLSQDSSKNED